MPTHRLTRITLALLAATWLAAGCKPSKGRVAANDSTGTDTTPHRAISDSTGTDTTPARLKAKPESLTRKPKP